MTWTLWRLDDPPRKVYRTDQPDMTASVYEQWDPATGHWLTLPGGNIVMDHLFGQGSVGVTQLTDLEATQFLADKAGSP